jgi:hypothetical protein
MLQFDDVRLGSGGAVTVPILSQKAHGLQLCVWGGHW